MRIRSGMIAGAAALVLLAGAAPGVRGDSEGEITFGSQWWSQSAREAKFQEFREIPKGGYIDQYTWRWAKDRWWINLYGANAIREDQYAGVMAGSGTRVKLEVDYTQVPHNISFVSRTPFYEASPGVYTLPDSLQASIQKNPTKYAAIMGDYLKSARNLNLGFRTDVAKSKLRAEISKGLTGEFHLVRRQRFGNKPFGASLGFSSATELPEPIDQRMIDADGSLSYEGGRGSTQFQLRATGGVSTFHNRVGALVWDNPQRITDASTGSSKGQIDLYPDNRVVRGGLEFGLRLPHQTLWSSQVSLSRFTQNDPWLPYTVNTSVAQSSMDSLPGTSTRGKATQLDFSSRFTSHLGNRLSGTLKVGHNHYKNETPAHIFPGIIPYDQSFTRGEIESDTASYKRTILGGDLDYRLPRIGNLVGSLEWRQRHRDFREVEKDKELVAGVRLHSQSMGAFSYQASAQFGHRKPDEYSIEEYEEAGKFIEQPNLRRFDIADRRFTQFGAGAGYSAGDKVDLGLDYKFEKSVYNNSEDNAAADTLLGLQNQRRHGITATATVHATKSLDLNLTYGFEQDSTFQRSREGPTGVVRLDDSLTWTATLENRDIFWSAGAEWDAVPRKLSFSGSFEFFRDLGRYRFWNFRKTSKDLPDTINRRYDFVLEARYRLSGNFELGGRYGYEQYDVQDLANENVPLLFPITGSATAIFLGDGLQDYVAHRMAMFATLRF